MKHTTRIAIALGLLQFIYGLDCVARPGNLVPDFGNGGLSRATISGSSLTINASAQQSDGKIVAVGSCTVTTLLTSFCVVRINADGSFTQSSSSLGSRTWHHSNAAGSAAIAYALSIDRHDRIIAAGQCTSTATGSDFCIVRFLRDGAIDQSFGNGGFVVLPIGSGTANERITALAQQNDGKLLATGPCETASNVVAMCLVRFHESGRLDLAFGTQGVARLSFALDASNRQDIPYALATGSDGTIFIGGGCQWSTNTTKQFCVIRVTPFGSRLGSHAISADHNLTGSSYIRAMAITADGKVWVAGSCNAGASTGVDFCIARYNPAASSSASTVFESLNFAYPQAVKRTAIGYQALEDSAASIVIQPDGRFIVAGTCALNPATLGTAMCWARYMPNGEEDRSIDSNTDGVGSVVTKFIPNTRNDRAASVLLQPDGSIILVGSCEQGEPNQYDLCAAKYEGGPFPTSQCTPDLDGDGRVDALIDGLIIARIALGIKTSAVMQGIVPPPHALRRSWHSGARRGIAEYLQRECGVNGLVFTRLNRSE